MLNLIYTESVLDSSTILTAAVVPFTGCFVNAYPLSNESFNNLAEDSLQTEASLVSKSTCMPYYTCRPSKKNKGLAGLPAMINARYVMRDSAIVQL